MSIRKYASKYDELVFYVSADVLSGQRIETKTVEDEKLGFEMTRHCADKYELFIDFPSLTVTQRTNLPSIGKTYHCQHKGCGSGSPIPWAVGYTGQWERKIWSAKVSLVMPDLEIGMHLSLD